MKSNTEKVFATLVRGVDYHLTGRNGRNDKVFLQGKPVEVSTEEHKWLQLHAVDRVTVIDTETNETLSPDEEFGGGVRNRTAKDICKFRFTTEPAQAPAAEAA